MEGQDQNVKVEHLEDGRVMLGIDFPVSATFNAGSTPTGQFRIRAYMNKEVWKELKKELLKELKG